MSHMMEPNPLTLVHFSQSLRDSPVHIHVEGQSLLPLYLVYSSFQPWVPIRITRRALKTMLGQPPETRLSLVL